jgi:hypothetical protein
MTTSLVCFMAAFVDPNRQFIVDDTERWAKAPPALRNRPDANVAVRAPRKDQRSSFPKLADNGLDNGAEVTVQSLPDKSGYVVEDDGTGINGVPEDVARLFSINRPMVSTKLCAALPAVEFLEDKTRQQVLGHTIHSHLSNFS